MNPKADFQKLRKMPGGVFLSYQKAWVEDKSEVKIIEKSRRIGISWAEAADSALYAASESGDDVWYIGYNKDMALEFISDCANWARHYSMAASEMEEEVFNDDDKDILTYRINFLSGHRITALSSRPTNLRGKQGRVILDEAAFHEDLSGLIKAAMALLIWGGQVRIISTHNGDSNEFNSLIQDVRAGKKPYSIHRVDFDEALDAGLYQRISKVLGRKWNPDAQTKWRQSVIDFYGDDADEELFVIPSQGSGVYLTRALIETCLSSDIPVVRYEQTRVFAEVADHLRYSEVEAWCEDTLRPLLTGLDENRQHYFGEDFGRTGDLTVILPLAEQQNANFKALFVLELHNMPFKQQEQILFYIVDQLPRFSFGALDARGNGQYLAERAMQKYGASRIAEVMLSDKWYRENMPRYKDAFEGKSILLPGDADIIEDHRAFKIIKGIAKLPDKKTKGKNKKQRHGDSGIAGALAWFATGQEGGVIIEFESTGQKRTHAGASMGNFIGA